MRELALFAGAGGGILGGKLLGWRTVCAVELDTYARSVLLARQSDGTLPRFPIWDDVTTFDGRPWRGHVDVVSGGFPCQDISAANPNGRGLAGKRSGLWVEFARIIGEVQPRWAFIENSPLLVSRGLSRVLWDLATLGYDASWGVVSAENTGAPHRRERIWILASNTRYEEHGQQAQALRPDSAESERALPGDLCAHVPDGADHFAGTQAAQSVHDANSTQCQGGGVPIGVCAEDAYAGGTSWWAAEPDVGRVADGVAARVDRLRCTGNGQVPAVVRLAWHLLSNPANTRLLPVTTELPGSVTRRADGDWW